MVPSECPDSLGTKDNSVPCLSGMERDGDQTRSHLQERIGWWMPVMTKGYRSPLMRSSCLSSLICRWGEQSGGRYRGGQEVSCDEAAPPLITWNTLVWGDLGRGRCICQEQLFASVGNLLAFVDLELYFLALWTLNFGLALLTLNFACEPWTLTCIFRTLDFALLNLCFAYEPQRLFCVFRNLDLWTLFVIASGLRLWDHVVLTVGVCCLGGLECSLINPMGGWVICHYTINWL